MAEIPSELTLRVEQEIEIHAPPERAFESLMQQLGDGFGSPENMNLSMRVEPWVGGRWFRDLGNGQGHLWGHVQVMKRPMLLELYGPLFMSYPAISHLQLRLADKGDGTTRLTLCHQALGLINPEHRKGVSTGWNAFMTGVKGHAEGK